jgi:hypothetical protein
MLARILCVALVALLGGLIATAACGQPAPPKLGSRAYTERAVDALHKAKADYLALNDQNSMNLDALDDAFHSWAKAMSDYRDAARAERDTYSDVKTALEQEAVAASTLKRMKGKSYDDEERARAAHDKAVEALEKARESAEAKIEKALGERIYGSANTASHHRTLQFKRLDEEKAALERQRKAEADKKGRESQASPPKSACPRGGGAAGALENIACQERQ